MKKIIVALLALSLVAAACGDDDTAGSTTTAATDGPQLTADERAWCTITDASETSALRFDQIFEGGLSLELPMDALNAQAADLRATYEADGLSGDEAVAKVFEDLVKEPVFIQACKQAYFEQVTSRAG